MITVQCAQRLSSNLLGSGTEPSWVELIWRLWAPQGLGVVPPSRITVQGTRTTCSSVAPSWHWDFLEGMDLVIFGSCISRGLEPQSPAKSHNTHKNPLVIPWWEWSKFWRKWATYIGIEGRVKVGRILEDLKRRVKFTLPKERFLSVSSTVKINLWKMRCVCERHRQTVIQTQGRKMRRWVWRAKIQSFFFQGHPFILFPSQEEFCSPHQVNVLNNN